MSVLILALVALGGSVIVDVLGWEVPGAALARGGVEDARGSGVGPVPREDPDPVDDHSAPVVTRPALRVVLAEQKPGTEGKPVHVLGLTTAERY